jgi:hypothetical protein
LTDGGIRELDQTIQSETNKNEIEKDNNDLTTNTSSSTTTTTTSTGITITTPSSLITGGSNSEGAVSGGSNTARAAKSPRKYSRADIVPEKSPRQSVEREKRRERSNTSSVPRRERDRDSSDHTKERSRESRDKESKEKESKEDKLDEIKDNSKEINDSNDNESVLISKSTEISLNSKSTDVSSASETDSKNELTEPNNNSGTITPDGTTGTGRPSRVIKARPIVLSPRANIPNNYGGHSRASSPPLPTHLQQQNKDNKERDNKDNKERDNNSNLSNSSDALHSKVNELEKENGILKSLILSLHKGQTLSPDMDIVLQQILTESKIKNNSNKSNNTTPTPHPLPIPMTLHKGQMMKLMHAQEGTRRPRAQSVNERKIEKPADETDSSPNDIEDNKAQDDTLCDVVHGPLLRKQSTKRSVLHLSESVQQYRANLKAKEEIETSKRQLELILKELADLNLIEICPSPLGNRGGAENNLFYRFKQNIFCEV